MLERDGNKLSAFYSPSCEGAIVEIMECLDSRGPNKPHECRDNEMGELDEQTRIIIKRLELESQWGSLDASGTQAVIYPELGSWNSGLSAFAASLVEGLNSTHHISISLF